MRKLLLTTSCLLLTLLALATPSPAAEDEDILIGDFEASDYGDWTVEGEAFGNAPAKGTQRSVSGFEGEGLVNTFLGGDGPTGTLTSPEFTIERDYIKFLIGGGGHEGKTCMNLLIDGDVVHSATGRSNEFLNWENWDVSKYKGQKAVLQIVDAASGRWGHVNIDQISQSSSQAKKKPAPPPRETDANPHLRTARSIKITGKYVIFPVANRGQRGRMTITRTLPSFTKVLWPKLPQDPRTEENI